MGGIMSEDARPPVEYFGYDTTLRLSCRRGDIVFWFRWEIVFVPHTETLTIPDVWVMRPGDFVTITNRLEDLPPWFELHPTEASGAARSVVMAKLQDGWQPEDPQDGPNLWRVRTGDRIAWVRPESSSGSQGSILQKILEFSYDALAVGDSNRADFSPLDFMDIGLASKSSSANKAGHFVVETVRKLGRPRSFSTEWSFG